MSIAPNDFQAVETFCLENDIELIVVGPEDPLANGVVDFFKNKKIRVFGPDRRAAQLESSKIFAKNS